MIIKDTIRQEWLDKNYFTEDSINRRIKELEEEFDLLEARKNELEKAPYETTKFFPYHEFEVKGENEDGTKIVYKHTRFKLFNLVKKYEKQILQCEEKEIEEPLKFSFTIDEIRTLIKYQNKVELSSISKIMDGKSAKIFHDLLEISKQYPELFGIIK